MRDLTAGQAQVIVPGGNVGQVIKALDTLHPGIKAHLYEGDELSPLLMAIVDGITADRGLYTKVQEDSEVHFVPAVSGGA